MFQRHQGFEEVAAHGDAVMVLDNTDMEMISMQAAFSTDELGNDQPSSSSVNNGWSQSMLSHEGRELREYGIVTYVTVRGALVPPPPEPSSAGYSGTLYIGTL